ncbi:ABC transporter substrate-binding protein [Allorhizobium sp. BGMRC 0089]|uniref:ABC transporter substrate-binding protein n=1 Tax=Allorhizobium sonneratiae TaxID=2934936 RepID=UPI002034658D|nr:ABC transporter substrate-binding protein [Allorhizobium sonneratiae]MCM2290751.1 ABC transporter substrate-binding protein [Allorhizobium sonneratiae]
MAAKISRRDYLLATGTGLAMAMAGVTKSAYAATPKDTLVVGWQIDDIITFDPGESFEMSAQEIISVTYQTLVTLDADDPLKIQPWLAESWMVSDDGMTYSFKIRKNAVFASGNPVTAADVAYSFERAIKLNKNPAFILQQFGLTADNITDKAKAVDDMTFQFAVDKAYAPSFVLNCLRAKVASIVDKKLVESHAAKVTPTADYKFDTDFGNGWLKTHYAGSGAFTIRDWRANELVVLERNPKFWDGKAKLARIIYRHMKESAGQRLALQNGDIDIARNLTPVDVAALSTNKDVNILSAAQGDNYYFSLNQKNQYLSKPEVREALKYLVDYDGIQATLIKSIGEIHQAFIPTGMLGAVNDNPYKLDVAKAKQLLEKAGLKDGFSVTMDVRSTEPVTSIAQSIQQTFGQAGVKLELIPGDGKQTLTKYRARNHDIYIGDWGTDYWDPNSNTQAFASNADNSDNTRLKTLAWRNAWDIPELTKQTEAALLERDTNKRASLYEDIQKKVMSEGPFVLIYQKIAVAGVRKDVTGFRMLPTSDMSLMVNVTKA